jgi:hypothetical protein
MATGPGPDFPAAIMRRLPLYLTEKVGKRVGKILPINRFFPQGILQDHQQRS